MPECSLQPSAHYFLYPCSWCLVQRLIFKWGPFITNNLELSLCGGQCQLLLELRDPRDGITFLSFVTTLFHQIIPGVFPSPQPGISGILRSILTMLIIFLSTTHGGWVLVRTVHKSWLHYAVMCVCWLLESRVGGVYKSPVALSLWWFQSAKGWQDCTKERNMSSIQNEPYVHTHTYIQTDTHLVY